MHSSVCPFCLRGKEGDKGKPRDISAQSFAPCGMPAKTLHRNCPPWASWPSRHVVVMNILKSIWMEKELVQTIMKLL